MNVSEVIDVIEKLAPAELCAAWDNSGFLVGNGGCEAKKILVVLDVTQETVMEAIANNCQLIVSHHPLIFSPIKKVTTDDFVGQILQLLIKNDLNLISVHTNLDNAGLGVNFTLAQALKLKDVAKIEVDNENPSYIGHLSSPLTGRELTALIKNALNIKHLNAVGLNEEQEYTCVAVCGGAGADLWKKAMAAGADCFLTAEGKHHIGIEAKHFGLTIIDAGHFDTEKLIIPALTKYLQGKCPDVDIVSSKINTNPWQII